MKRVPLLLVVSVISAVGYFIGTINAMVNEKFAVMDNVVGGGGKEENEPGKKKLIENFDSFIYKFIADSAFQLERIQFPLKASINTEVNKQDAALIKKQDWKIVRLFGNHEYRSQIYDNFTREMRDTDERLFCWEGVENGVLCL